MKTGGLQTRDTIARSSRVDFKKKDIYTLFVDRQALMQIVIFVHYVIAVHVKIRAAGLSKLHQFQTVKISRGSVHYSSEKMQLLDRKRYTKMHDGKLRELRLSRATFSEQTMKSSEVRQKKKSALFPDGAVARGSC